MAARNPRAVRVGAKIRAARLRKGYSQAELAQHLPAPIEGAYVSRWERGENMPSWPNLERIAAVLDVTLASLLTDD